MQIISFESVAGSTKILVTSDDVSREVSAAQAETMIGNNLANGARLWRNVRTSDGSIMQVETMRLD